MPFTEASIVLIEICFTDFCFAAPRAGWPSETKAAIYRPKPPVIHPEFF